MSHSLAQLWPPPPHPKSTCAHHPSDYAEQDHGTCCSSVMHAWVRSRMVLTFCRRSAALPALRRGDSSRQRATFSISHGPTRGMRRMSLLLRKRPSACHAALAATTPAIHHTTMFTAGIHPVLFLGGNQHSMSCKHHRVVLMHSKSGGVPATESKDKRLELPVISWTAYGPAALCCFTSSLASSVRRACTSPDQPMLPVAKSGNNVLLFEVLITVAVA